MAVEKVDEQSTLNFILPFSFKKEILQEIENDKWEEDKSLPKEEMILHISKYINPSDKKDTTALFLRLKNSFLTSKDFLGADCEWFLELNDEEQIQFKIKGVQLA